MENELKEICYNKNFLTEVIARIDFVSPVSLETDLPKEISKTVMVNFPISEPRDAFHQDIIVNPINDELKSNRQNYKEWVFFGIDRKKLVNISKDFLFISDVNYSNFEEFKNNFINITKVFFQVFNDAQPARLGLRYINQLNLPGNNISNLNEYISEELLGLFKFNLKDALPIRIFHNYEVAYSDFNLQFQFGVHNPDYPAKIVKNIFILDFDASFKGLLEPTNIEKSLDCYHQEIQKLFERSITDKTRDLLNE